MNNIVYLNNNQIKCFKVLENERVFFSKEGTASDCLTNILYFDSNDKQHYEIEAYLQYDSAYEDSFKFKTVLTKFLNGVLIHKFRVDGLVKYDRFLLNKTFNIVYMVKLNGNYVGTVPIRHFVLKTKRKSTYFPRKNNRFYDIEVDNRYNVELAAVKKMAAYFDCRDQYTLEEFIVACMMSNTFMDYQTEYMQNIRLGTKVKIPLAHQPNFQKRIL